MKFFLIAGEPSGDALGAGLMAALRELLGKDARFAGVGGPAMTEQGLDSLFPLSDIAVMGVMPVIAKLPTLLDRIRCTAQAAVDWRPDALVVIDSPDFTHRVARKVRRQWPSAPIIDYVSPTVWAWRPGRARAMRAYIDRVLAVLPFEPDAHRRLGGPPCVYVGHPLTQHLDLLRPSSAEAERRAGRPPIALLLPGSREQEIARLLAVFGAAAERIESEYGEVDWVLPAVRHLEARIADAVASWRKPPRLVRGEMAKWDAFRNARVAIAASGTVTLELALAGVPMVVAYKVSPVEYLFRFLVSAPSIVLPNLVVGAKPVPELLQAECSPDRLALETLALLREGPARQAQVEALAAVARAMSLPGGMPPSEAAARQVIEAAGGVSGG